MTKLLWLLAVLTMAATLAFGQAADRPASTTDRQDANAPVATRTDDAPRKTIGVGSVFWGWQDSPVCVVITNATCATGTGMQQTFERLRELWRRSRFSERLTLPLCLSNLEYK
jgi:hypothetical protein